MPKKDKPESIEVGPGHHISTKAIMAIKQRADGEIEVRYMRGYTERVRGMTMEELLIKLGRMPEAQVSADRTQPPTVG